MEGAFHCQSLRSLSCLVFTVHLQRGGAPDDVLRGEHEGAAALVLALGRDDLAASGQVTTLYNVGLSPWPGPPSPPRPPLPWPSSAARAPAHPSPGHGVVREDDLWVKGACRVGHCHGRGLTSTLSTATPQYSVPSASRSWHCYKNVDSDSCVSVQPTCISCAILTRSERMSPSVRVPSTFRSVVAASACADPA